MAKKKQDRNNKGNIHPKRIFKTPEDMYKAFTEYKDSRKDEAKNWPKIQYVGKDGNKVIDFPVMPLSVDGFEVWAYNHYGNIGQYFDNKEGYYDDFVVICSRIRKEVRDNQINGGMMGYFNPSITQRLNNLKEQSETNINSNISVLSFDPLSDESDAKTNNGTKKDSGAKETD